MVAAFLEVSSVFFFHFFWQVVCPAAVQHLVDLPEQCDLLRSEHQDCPFSRDTHSSQDQFLASSVVIELRLINGWNCVEMIQAVNGRWQCTMVEGYVPHRWTLAHPFVILFASVPFHCVVRYFMTGRTTIAASSSVLMMISSCIVTSGKNMCWEDR
jgi:hypothetical protein